MQSFWKGREYQSVDRGSLSQNDIVAYTWNLLEMVINGLGICFGLGTYPLVEVGRTETVWVDLLSILLLEV